MLKQEYPLDINVLRSVALEGGLSKYYNALPKLPDGGISFVHEWNLALMSTLRGPEFKKRLGALGRTMVSVRSPGLTAFALDKLAVPYRSFYYAKRFTDAYHHISEKVTDLQELVLRPNVVDFGRGLSPLMHLIQRDCRFVTPYSIDQGIINDIYAKTSNLMGLPNNERMVSIDDIKNIPQEDQHVFTSLGAFVYLPIDAQQKLLTSVVQNFKHFYVELEHNDAMAPDAKLMAVHGATYHEGWDNNNLKEIFGPAGYKSTGILNEFMRENRDRLDWLTVRRIARKLCYASEMFIQR